MENDTKQKTELIKNRNPFIALIFSIILPGLGQLYNGQLKKGIIFASINSIITLLFYFSKLPFTFNGLFLILLIELVLALLIIIDAVVIAKQQRNYILKPSNRVYIYILILFCGIGMDFGVKKLNTSGLKSYRITSFSMENTIYKGDFVMCDNDYYSKHKPKRGDLIAFNMPGSDLNICERVIAIPGDTIEIKDKIVYINGQKETADFIKYVDDKIQTADRGPRDNMEPLLIQDDFYFVMGDNRDVSKDSRYFGEIDKTDLVGKLEYVYFSYGKEPLDKFKDIIKDFSGRLPERKSRVRFERIGKKLQQVIYEQI